MIKTESRTENCTSCVHFGYCMVYWGAECKRQGGKRIPRMKPTPVDIAENTGQPCIEPEKVRVNKPDILTLVGKETLDKPKNSRKPDMLKKIVELFEPIRTKVANW